MIGYQSLYQVSNHGRVKSLRKNIILKSILNSRKYCQITLSKNNNQCNYSIHRLVAIHFIPNLENKPQVNHIDGNKQNNHVNNLEWCTIKENIQHAYDTGLKENTRDKKYCSKKVKCIETGIVYESTREAGRQLNISNGNISKCCNGKRKSIGGYTWKYI